jgi:peptidoglycan/LPS O-acetylase OafA/YrhL
MDGRSQRIDALRGLAISAVILYHYVYTTGALELIPVPYLVKSFVWNGLAGVDLFFVLSAYLLTRNLLRHADAPNASLTFYGRRMLRIMPMFLLLMAAGLGLRAIWTQFAADPDTWLWHGAYPAWVYLLFLQDIWPGLSNAWTGHFFAPTWSLAVEEHFYLLLPLLVCFLRRRTLAIIAAIWIVSAPFVRAVILGHVGIIAAYSWPIARLDSFGWGIMLALLPQLAPELTRRLSPRFLGAFALAGFTLFAVMHHPHPAGAMEPLVGLTVVALLAACAVFAVAHWPGKELGGAPIRALAWTGERCFSLYLLHMPVLGLTFMGAGMAAPNSANAASLMVFAGAAMVTFGLAALSFEWVERPFMAVAEKNLRYRAVLAARNRPAASTVVGPAAAGRETFAGI